MKGETNRVRVCCRIRFFVSKEKMKRRYLGYTLFLSLLLMSSCVREDVTVTSVKDAVKENKEETKKDIDIEAQKNTKPKRETKEDLKVRLHAKGQLEREEEKKNREYKRYFTTRVESPRNPDNLMLFSFGKKGAEGVGQDFSKLTKKDLFDFLDFYARKSTEGPVESILEHMYLDDTRGDNYWKITEKDIKWTLNHVGLQEFSGYELLPKKEFDEVNGLYTYFVMHMSDRHYISDRYKDVENVWKLLVTSCVVYDAKLGEWLYDYEIPSWTIMDAGKRDDILERNRQLERSGTIDEEGIYILWYDEAIGIPEAYYKEGFDLKIDK